MCFYASKNNFEIFITKYILPHLKKKTIYLSTFLDIQTFEMRDYMIFKVVKKISGYTKHR